MTSCLFLVAAILAITSASPATAQQKICDQGQCFQVDEVCSAATGCVKRISSALTEDGFFKVRIEGEREFRLSRTKGAGPVHFDLPRGKQKFSTSLCSPSAPLIAEFCSEWANFSLAAAPAPPPPPPSASAPHCEAYATNAVAQAQAGQGCGFRGGRWDTNKAVHLQWCIGQGANQTLPNAETAARDKELRNCAIKNPYYQQNVSMPGRDYRSFETTKAADAECSTACSNDAPQCKAWTWARAGTPQGGAKGRCFLKTAAPNGVFDQCCISGLYRGITKAGKAAPATETPGPAQQSPAPAPQQQANNTCGPAGGKAVVVIPEPNLDKLNVRASPGGRVLSTIPEGATVTIMGACGTDGAAGFRAPSQSAEGDWCRIGGTVSGCVMAKYLQLGGSSGAAGFSRQKTSR